MVLTSSAYVRPLSALWRLGERMERMHIYRSDSIVKFANTSVQRIVGTCGEQASVYDTETNIVVDTYRTPEHCGHHYKKNTASFSPDDRLIFNDGLLWDIRNRNNFIHRFDRLNKNALFGTFHPHGTQLIIDQEVYDIRTLRVVHHVPELANQQISFNSTGNIMYVSECAELTREEDFPESTVSSFRTFDTSDYSALTTFEGKRPVLDLCTSHRDQTMCLIEQLRPQMNDYMVQASTHLRMVEIGRLKDTEDENEEEEDDLRQENSSAYGSDGSDSDNDEDDDENEDNDEDDDDVDDMLRERGSVFEALGRLGDDSSDDSDSNLSDVDFEEMLNQMIHQARQRRNNPSNGGGGGGARRPLFAVNIDENGAEPPALPDESNDSDGAIEEEEDEGDNDAEEDPDFDMDAAIDDLVDRVDDEVDEDEMDAFSESEGSWRTASQIGSEDINLDDLDEEAAAAAQNEDHPAENRRRGADEESRDAQRLRGLARDFRNFGDRIRQSGPTSDILNARVEEQRANFMEALGREGQQQNARQADPEPENFEEEEEEIMSVSSVALNPALRRKQRRENQ
uniref:Uncharacterized protein n=1 Tax=Caenorhabditis japonica TaxID=281687 RepID=A0A8R1DTK7_CAEJA